MKKVSLLLVKNAEEEILKLTELQENLTSVANLEMSEQVLANEIGKKEFLALIEPFDIVAIDVPLRMKLKGFVDASSTQSHFINYCDVMIRRGQQWWAHSVFSEVCNTLFLKILKKNDFRGPVLFLGPSTVCLPTIETLARFNFSDVVFLDVERQTGLDEEEFYRSLKALINVKVKTVDSTTFIQSQAEYAFCFITHSEYSQQILEDMSYFHFLSPRSTVIDLSGGSNFMYKEVEALDFEVYRHEQLRKLEVEAFTAAILDYFSQK